MLVNLAPGTKGDLSQVEADNGLIFPPVAFELSTLIVENTETTSTFLPSSVPLNSASFGIENVLANS